MEERGTALKIKLAPMNVARVDDFESAITTAKAGHALRGRRQPQDRAKAGADDSDRTADARDPRDRVAARAVGWAQEVCDPKRTEG
jgi:hypothetical protein